MFLCVFGAYVLFLENLWRRLESMVVAGDLGIRAIDKLELVIAAEDTDIHLGDKLDWRKAKVP